MHARDMWGSKQQQPGVDGLLAGGRRGVDSSLPAGSDMDWQDLERAGGSTGPPRTAGVSFGGPPVSGGARDGDMEWQDPESSGVGVHRSNMAVGSPDSDWSVDAVGGTGWGAGGGGTPPAWTGGPASRQASITSESGDTGFCFSDGTEDRCSLSSGSSGFSFKPIRSLAPIPTAHVVPSAAAAAAAALAGAPPSPPLVSPTHPCGRRRSRAGVSGLPGRPLRVAWDPECSSAAGTGAGAPAGPPPPPSSRAEREGRPGKERVSRPSLAGRGSRGLLGETAPGAGLHRGAAGGSRSQERAPRSGAGAGGGASDAAAAAARSLHKKWSSLTRLHGGGGGASDGAAAGAAPGSAPGGRRSGDESSEAESSSSPAAASRSGGGGGRSPGERGADGADGSALGFAPMPESKPPLGRFAAHGQHQQQMQHQQQLHQQQMQQIQQQQHHQQQVVPLGLRAGGGFGAPAPAWPPGGALDEAGVVAWQQQQLEELRRHVSDLQLMNGSPRQDAYSGLPLSALTKWDALLKVKESLLQEKDLAIEKQKQQLLLLQQRVQETEARLQALVLPPSARPAWLDQAALSLHLQQESQLESASLRAQLSERAGALAAERGERGELERRLADADLRARAAGEAARQHAEGLARAEEKLRHKDKQLSSLRKRVEREVEARAERARRVESLETYLADLPTLELHQALRLKLEQTEARAAQLEGSTTELQAQLRGKDNLLRERDSLLDREVQAAVARGQAGLEGRAAEMERALRERERELRAVRQREQELVATVQTLQQKVERCLSDGARLPVLGLESLQRDNQRLRDDCERARKIIENQQRRLDTLVQQRGDEERAARDGAGAALQERHALQLHAAERDAHVHELLAALKSLTAEKEGLFSRCLELQERLEAVGGGAAGGSAGPGEEEEGLGAGAEPLVTELCATLREMRVLCDVMSARAHGRQPDLSQLLGLDSAATAAEEASRAHGAWAATRSRARQLRSDVEALRAVIADRCAQDVGDSCITQ